MWVSAAHGAFVRGPLSSQTVAILQPRTRAEPPIWTALGSVAPVVRVAQEWSFCSGTSASVVSPVEAGTRAGLFGRWGRRLMDFLVVAGCSTFAVRVGRPAWAFGPVCTA